MSNLNHEHDSEALRDRKAPAELLPQVYEELRKLAPAKMRNEAEGHTLNATALVNEAWLKLNAESFANKSGFIRAAAVAMRRILVDHARTKKSAKRGGENLRANLDPDQIAKTNPDSDIAAIDAALDEFAVVDPQAAELVQLRYFSGIRACLQTTRVFRVVGSCGGS